jgi:hypothetical protein
MYLSAQVLGRSGDTLVSDVIFSQSELCNCIDNMVGFQEEPRTNQCSLHETSSGAIDRQGCKRLVKQIHLMNKGAT